MSPHLPSYQTFINFIMRGLQTDISPLTDALWWHSVLVLFLDDSELPVVPANWRETLEFVCQTKKALVVSGGNYPLCYFQRRFSFFFLTQEDKSLTQTHRLQPGAFYFIHLLIYLNVTLDVTAPNVCFCCCQVGQVLIKSCRVVSEQSRNILAVGELTSVHCSGLNVGTLYTGVFLNHVQLVASTLLTADILTCHCSDSTVQTNVKAENSFPAVSFLIAIIWRSWVNYLVIPREKKRYNEKPTLDFSRSRCHVWLMISAGSLKYTRTKIRRMDLNIISHL